MLDCETQEVWYSTYGTATAIIAHEPRQQLELDKIIKTLCTILTGISMTFMDQLIARDPHMLSRIMQALFVIWEVVLTFQLLNI
eukprot:4022966-Ditylum_brightwellii.AAC.1